ncbi:hypothetical protein L1987_54117 [Smallanthus sonchifolius]|uniref:Uncharacterized protein n=1 Tax=Smallanthus sonchifolius TaxID=185202 RepID=A0ACB9E656_9ASTR|nr:hypothetical protein L1987_54117 [Smallanthus sonchifolius]
MVCLIVGIVGCFLIHLPTHAFFSSQEHRSKLGFFPIHHRRSIGEHFHRYCYLRPTLTLPFLPSLFVATKAAYTIVAGER